MFHYKVQNIKEANAKTCGEYNCLHQGIVNEAHLVLYYDRMTLWTFVRCRNSHLLTYWGIIIQGMKYGLRSLSIALLIYYTLDIV